MSVLAAADPYVELSVKVQNEAGVLYPGLDLHPVVKSKKGGAAFPYEDVQLELLCESKQHIAGHNSATSKIKTGIIDAYPTLHTMEERLSFCSSLADISSSSPAEISYSVSIPTYASDILLPATPKRTIGLDEKVKKSDASARVTWALKLTGWRKGTFKRHHVGLVLELPVVFSSAHFQTSQVVEKTFCTNLKFEGADSAAEPTVDIKFSATQPLLASQPLLFRLSLLLSPSTVALLNPSSLPAPTCVLARQVRTAPVASPSSGVEEEWPAIKVAGGALAPAGPNGSAKVSEGEWTWHGSVVTPKGDHTVESPGLSIKYLISATLTSPALAGGSANVRLPVFLPSSPINLAPTPTPSPAQAQLPAYS